MAADRDEAPIGYVLIHGAELGAWLWDLITPRLDGPAVAVDLPGRGRRPADRRAITVDDAVAAIVDDVERCTATRVVVVAHSFAGVLVPPAVAQLGPRVAASVFVGATVPEEGRSWADLQPAAQRLLLRVLRRLRPAGALSPAGQNRKLLCHDLDDQTTRAFLASRVPEAPGLLFGEVTPATLPPDVARHYVRLGDDRAVPSGTAQASIDRLGDARVHDLDTGHLPMLSRPDALAAILREVGHESRVATTS